MTWMHIFAGFGVGFTVGLTGVGGGSLMTPLLIFLFGYAPSSAVGTDLLFASLTKTGGGLVHALRRNVDWRVVARLCAGSLPAAVATILVLDRLGPRSHAFESVISATLGVSLLLTAAALLLRDRINLLRGRFGGERGLPAHFTVLTGVILGILVTLTSVGAGALGTVALFFLYPRMPVARLIGSDIVHAVPLTAVAGLGHLHLGTVDYHLLGNLLIGSLPGIWIGSRLGSHMPEKLLRPLLALMLAIIGLRFVF